MEITGIILGTVASCTIIGLFIWLNSRLKDQEMNTALLEGELEGARHAYEALMKNFNDYQAHTDRKIVELEKQLEIKSNKAERRIDKLDKDLPSIIGRVVGQIELAQDTINRKM